VVSGLQDINSVQYGATSVQDSDEISTWFAVGIKKELREQGMD
jgi:hypothetical protein